jgi:hypothetical protein
MNAPSLPALDSAKVAGLMVVAAVVVLAVTRRAFGGVRVGLGD